MRVEYHPEARAEVKSAALYYESCRPGLGIRFVEAVEAAVDLIPFSTPTTAPASAWPRPCESSSRHGFSFLNV
jgi:hypothetical protein